MVKKDKLQFTLEEILNMQNALEEVAKVKMPIKTSYWIGKYLRLCREEVQTFQNVRTNLIRELGERVDGAEESYKVKDENVRSFQEQIVQLLKVTETYTNMPVFSLSDFSDMEIEAWVMAGLSPILILDDEDGDLEIEFQGEG